MRWLKQASPHLILVAILAMGPLADLLSAEDILPDLPHRTGPALTASPAEPVEEPAPQQDPVRPRIDASPGPEISEDAGVSEATDIDPQPMPGESAAEEKKTQEAPVVLTAPKPAEKSAEPAEKTSESAEETAEPLAKPERMPELSKEMAAFRDRIRRTVARYYQQPFNTSSNTAGDVLLFAMAFGYRAEIRHGSDKINAVGCLCWNFPCAGYRLLRAGNAGIVPRIGYGLQSQPSQLLAVLGQLAVPVTYELRVGQQRGTVADLVSCEKQTCRAGQDQSLKLLGLSCYVPDDETWQNDFGEDWSLERLVEEELSRTVAIDDSAATSRLLGLSYAVDARKRAGRPLEDPYDRAAKFLGEFFRHALSVQNDNGSWDPGFFAARGESRDLPVSLRSTGHIFQWLAYWVPESQLQTAEMLRAASYLDNGLTGMASRWNPASATPGDTDAVAHALSALTIYDHRVFRPYDNRPQPVESP